MNERDLIIIGAGPAGCSAAIYAVRAGLKPLICGGAVPGGQLLQTSELENYVLKLWIICTNNASAWA